MKHIAILTSGGDAPGMNAAIRAATLVARSLGIQVDGIHRGYRGLLEDNIKELLPGEVDLLFRQGGTILHSTRCLEFHEMKARNKARSVLAKRGIDGLIVIGGNGSLAGAMALGDPKEGADGLSVIGIPASIDNDIGHTGMCIGVDTAMNTIVEACDKISDTASAHDRTFIVEVMGRECGYLAMTAGIASGADLVLFPEAHKTEEEVIEAAIEAVLKQRDSFGHYRSTLIIKAEGVGIPTESLKKKIDERLGVEAGSNAPEIETRVTVLGHVVRGGKPSAFDRLLASRFGNIAVRALMEGHTRKMTSWMPHNPLSADIAVRTSHDPCCWLVNLPAVFAETQRLLTGDSLLAQWRSSVFDRLDTVLSDA